VSHIIVEKLRVIRNLRALEMACQFIGNGQELSMQLSPGCELGNDGHAYNQQGQRIIHGNLHIPGIGNKKAAATLQQAHNKWRTIGIVPHTETNGELTYRFAHDQDFKVDYDDIMQHYALACAKLAADEAGHSFECARMADGSYHVRTDVINDGLVSA
jgi:hypothetical protein